MEQKTMNEQMNAIIAGLTLEEKVKMIHGSEFFKTAGVDRMQIPPVVSSDGPMGVRTEFYPDRWITIDANDDFVTYGVSNSALANTWNKELAYETGKVLGEEARGRGKDMILAPGINIKRNPVCGRNFEYFSEDPLLTAQLVMPMVKGIQEADVAACVKHFALNNQESERLWVNVEVDEKTLQEIYLPAFKAALVDAGAYSVMGAYNLFRKVHCCQNHNLLTKILREDWGYEGVAISDWGGVHDTKLVAESGLDIEMSVTDDFDEYFMANPLIEAVKKGEIDEKHIDEKVRHILLMMIKIHMIKIVSKLSEDGKEEIVIEKNKDRKPGAYNTWEHQKKVLETARESIVLLKNEENRLPLSKDSDRKILVIGDNASRLQSHGGGSAEIRGLYEKTPLIGIKELLGGNHDIKFAKGYFVPNDARPEESWQETSTEDGQQWTASMKRDLTEDEIKLQDKLLVEAVELAKNADDVIIVCGLNHDYDVEGADRTDLELPYNQNAMIEAVLEVNPNAVIVVMAGSPVAMQRWSHKAKAILWMSYSGMEGGKAIAEVLYGDVNPSGKLSETMPFKLEDCGAYALADGTGRKLTEEEKKEYEPHIRARLTESYTDGLLVGYRYYEKKNVPVQYEFGYGLSYTKFEFCEPKLTLCDKIVDGKKVVCEAGITVTNVGDVTGKEVVQIYIGNYDADEKEPVAELKAFDKIELSSKESKTVSIPIFEDAFHHFNEGTKQFELVKGKYFIRIATSVSDIKAVLDLEM